MNVFETKEVQELLRAATNIDGNDGNAHFKQIVNRLLGDLFKAIDDLDITLDEVWTGINYLNKLRHDREAALLTAGLGLEKYLDIRMDASDKATSIDGGTPRTVEGPLYVAGAPLRDGISKIDINPDADAGPLIIHGSVTGPDRKPVAGAVVECWHANSMGFYSHFDPTGGAKRLQPARCGENRRGWQVRIPHADTGRLWLSSPRARRRNCWMKSPFTATVLHAYKDIEFNISLTPLVQGKDNQIVNRLRRRNAAGQCTELVAATRETRAS